MTIKRNKKFTVILCFAMAAILILGFSGCAAVGTKQTAKLNERLMAMFTQLDTAKDSAVLNGTATDDYIRQYYDLRQSLVNLSPYLPEGGVEMDRDTYKGFLEKIEAAEAAVTAFVEK